MVAKFLSTTCWIAVAASGFLAGACDDDDDDDVVVVPPGGDGDGDGTVVPVGRCFVRTDLVGSTGYAALREDPNLVNAWGITPLLGAFGVVAADTGKLAMYQANGDPARDTKIADGLDVGEGLTGIAANTTDGFMVSNETSCLPAAAIIASEEGLLFGVGSDVDPSRAFVAVDRSAAAASYFGVAILDRTLLAADFHNGNVDVFDENFQLVTSPRFLSPSIPVGFAPFNVAVLDGTVYVGYAKQDEAKADEVVGAGLGYVSAFDATGRLLWSIGGAPFNAPWGLSIAPASFGDFSNALLVGNFGDGRIIAIDRATHTVLGQLADATGTAHSVAGLWGLSPGTGVTNAAADGIYFAAGPEDETQGVYGVIAPCQPLE